MTIRQQCGSWAPVDRALVHLREISRRAANDIRGAREAVARAAKSLSSSQRAIAAAELLAIHDEFFPSRRKSKNEHQIYFVQRVDGGPIKIGFSRDVAGRVAALQTSVARELHVLATVPGDRALELEVHRRLSACRVRGEWFEDCDAVRRMIERLRLAGSE